MNKAILMGRLTKDPELRYTSNNMAVCRFTIAVNRKYSKQGEEKQADFLPIVAWDKTAEFCGKYFTKGQHIYDKEKAKTQKPLDDNRRGSVVDVENCGSVSFDGCELVGCGIYGIFAGNTEEIAVMNCYLHHNSVKALCFINTKGITNVLIKDSRIVNNADFMQKEGNVNVNMNENNIIENNTKQGYLNR
jgi:hypothetical protein